MRKTFADGELTIAKDAHHRGFWLWGWDGTNLWIKASTSTKKWCLVKSVKLTPRRREVINKLTHGKGLSTVTFKRGSEL